MFIKFSDQTPKIDIEQTSDELCSECQQAIVTIKEETKCGCNVDSDIEKKAINFFTQKIETANNQK